jgi:hypothetical protein
VCCIGGGSAAIAGTESGKPTQKKAEASHPHSKSTFAESPFMNALGIFRG